MEWNEEDLLLMVSTKNAPSIPWPGVWLNTAGKIHVPGAGPLHWSKTNQLELISQFIICWAPRSAPLLQGYPSLVDLSSLI